MLFRQVKKKIWTVVAVILIILTMGFFALSYAYYADVTALEKMEFIVNDVSFPELGFNYCKLKFILNISNPTNYRISSLSISFTIYLANNSIGDGSMEDISIHAHSSIEKDMVITIYYMDVVEGVIDAIRNGNFLLTIKGTSTADVLFGLTTASRNFEISYTYAL